MMMGDDKSKEEDSAVQTKQAGADMSNPAIKM